MAALAPGGAGKSFAFDVDFAFAFVYKEETPSLSAMRSLYSSKSTTVAGQNKNQRGATVVESVSS